MLKPMQKEPCWSYDLHFIICFSHYSLSAISQTCFHVRQKLYHYISFPFHKSYFNMQKKCHGRVFKQLWNHSFFFNSYEIIHLWCLHVVEACHFTVNWFLICFFLSAELFLTSKMKIQHKSQESNLE